MATPRIPTSEDLRAAARLHQDDEQVLEEVMRQLGAPVRDRLRLRFGRALSEDDLDDVLSIALYRLWLYRKDYDPAKGSIGQWYYLIARSAAVDLLRREHLPLARETDSVAAPAAAEAPVAASEATARAQRLQAALAQLPEVDRRIVTAYAEGEGRVAWSVELSRELVMPPSTVRSRKRRAMIRLRQMLQSSPPKQGGE